MEYPLGVQFRYDLAPLILELKNVYSARKCQEFINRIEAASPNLATDNPSYRNQDRVIFDDKDAATDLFARTKESLPKKVGEFTLKRLNERLRCFRYAAGQYFEPHMDHWYQASEHEISLYSMLVYLNGGFEGGETRFMEQLESVIKPCAGKVAVFQHKIRHEGCRVTAGIKYAIRTDVIYEKGE